MPQELFVYVCVIQCVCVCVCVCVILCRLLVTMCTLFLSLNPNLRAVEFFIRDKYERKKYYDKNALSPAPVSVLPPCL